MHGEIMRMINCDNANVDRTISAAEEQKEWIIQIATAGTGRAPAPEELSDPGAQYWTDGLRTLPGSLQEVAFLRLYKPEASLTEIGESLTPQVGKAAVSKRFSKIRSLAKEALK
jgi:DNA-binding transcriptional regulator WhiA